MTNLSDYATFAGILPVENKTKSRSAVEGKIRLTLARYETREKEQDNDLVEKKFIFSERDKEKKKRRIIAKRSVFGRLNYSICLGNSSFSSM